MPQIMLRYDMRAPGFGTPAATLYGAALEQCAWADAQGLDRIQLSEHHGADDGYLPSPLVMAAAIAGCTRRLRLQIAAVILPLHDPLRIAEDIAVLDLVSGGRVEVVVGAGYVPTEFAMFERRLEDRPALVEEGVEVLKSAFTGEPFAYRGRRVRVRPRPVQRPRPPILLGGSSKAAARRAARIADGFVPALPHFYKDYLAELERLGKPAVPGGRAGPMFLHVSEDPDKTWARIAPHALHEVNSYGRWLHGTGTAGPFQPTEDADGLRTSRTYRVVTPDECVALAEKLGPTGALMLHPLMGGMPPELGWESLELFAAKVLPRIERGPGRA